jgi:tetratricopeptide (TPR) repeat protein
MASAIERPRSRSRRLGKALIFLTVITILSGAAVWYFRPPFADSIFGPRQVLNWKPIEAAAARQNWAEVDRQIGPWIQAHADDGKAYVLLAFVRISQGREAESLESLKTVKPDDPSWITAQNILGDLAFARKDAAESERIYRGLAAKSPQAIPPRQRLVYLYSLQLRTAEARAVLWEMYRAKLDPDQLAELVLASFQVENDVRGLGPELPQFLKTTPNDPYLQRAWGLSLHWRGKPAEALPYLESAAEALDNDLTGRFALAECRLALGILPPDTDIETILGPRPASASSASLWYVMASQLADVRGKSDASFEFLRKAVEANPENREACIRLGQALTRRGKPDEAKLQNARAEVLNQREKTLKRAHNDARREGFNAEWCERLGLLCNESHLTTEAREWLELSLKYEPNRASARAALDRIPRTSESNIQPILLSRRTQRPRPSNAAPPTQNASAAKAVRFEDIASQSGLTYQYDCAATGDMFIGDTMGGGVGLIDYDGDGWLDVYLVNGCKLPIDPKAPARPNKLFRNTGHGTFEDMTERAGVPGNGYGMGCTVGDYDNDGHDDLFVTGLGQTVLYHNNGDGTFKDVTAQAGVTSSRWSTASGFGDLDSDGDLDLMVVTYVTASPATSTPCLDQTGRPIHCSPGYYAAEFDILFRNNGDGTFTDISREAGIEVPSGRGLGLAIADFDDDGRLDLFVANDASPNFLFRNLGGLKFEEVGLSMGIGCDGSGRATASMGVAAADLDGDGRIDLFHTNFINEPNTLRLNSGGGFFRDATLAANLDAPSRALTGFGTAALDVDNDGLLDLFVANGHVDDQPWVNSPMAQLPALFMNQGNGRFVQASRETSPYFARPVVGRGVAAGDLDNDGRTDLLVIHRDVPAALLRNQTEGGGHWLGLRLQGVKSGHTPVGARVTCRAGGRTTVRWLTSGTSYLSSNDPRLSFGLGSSTTIEKLDVHWPSGLTQSWSNLPIDIYLNLQEGSDPKLPTKKSLRSDQ